MSLKVGNIVIVKKQMWDFPELINRKGVIIAIRGDQAIIRFFEKHGRLHDGSCFTFSNGEIPIQSGRTENINKCWGFYLDRDVINKVNLQFEFEF